MIANVEDFPGGGAEQDPAPDTVQKHSVKPIDSANHWDVVKIDEQHSDLCVFIQRMKWLLTPGDAVNLAAWLVATADPDRKEFERLFSEIKK